VSVSDTLPNTSGLSWTISPAVTGCSISATNPQVLTCNFGDLASGATRTIHVSSPTSAASCGTINNTATYTTTNVGNGSSSQASVVVQCATVSLTKAANPTGPVSAGDTIGFDIGLTIGGSGTASSVTVSDTLANTSGLSWTISPAVTGCSISATNPQVLTCNFGDLASGATRTIHVSSPTSAA